MTRQTRPEYNLSAKHRTRTDILHAAMRIAKRYGLAAVKRDAVATEARCGAGTVNFHFQTVRYLHDEVLKFAVNQRELRVIAEGVVGGYSAVADIGAELRKAALAAYK